MAGCLAHFPIGMGSLYQYSEMTLGTEIGETSYNMLMIYPIQSNRERSSDDEYIVASQQDSIGFFEKRSSYVHPQLWVSGTFKRSLNWRNCGTLPPKNTISYRYLLGDLLYILL